MKYQVLKPVEKRGWEEGDIVMVQGDMPENDVLTPYEGEEPHKHVLVVVDPVTLTIKE